MQGTCFTYRTMLLACLLLGRGVAYSVEPTPELEIKVIFDNTSGRADLPRSWGFSALIDFRGRRVLFDAGSDPVLLLENMERMQIDPSSIEHAVISHQHGDHLRGVYWVFEENPKMQVHFLDVFPEEAFRRAAAVGMKPHRVKGPFEVVPGIFSTGIVDGLPPEQSIVIETSQGMVMLVGCSHPGLIKLVDTAQQQRKQDSLRLLLGGFHLLRKQPEDVKSIIAQLKQRKVDTVLPGHCTGDEAIDLFHLEFGDRFHAAGTGRQIRLLKDEFAIQTLKRPE